MKITDILQGALLIMLLILCSTSQARYLQADRLDILSRSHDPEILVGEGKGVFRKRNQIQLNHAYGYVNQNPVNYIDPTGLTPEGAAIGSILGSGTGLILGGGIGSLAGPGGTLIMSGEGAAEGAVIGGVVGDALSDLMCKDDCAKEIAHCELICSASATDADRKNVYGGSHSTCMNGCVSARCGGNGGGGMF